jgi:hypothetical protein
LTHHSQYSKEESTVAQTPEEFENSRRHNQPTGKHGQGAKGQNKAKPGGDRHDNEAHPRSDQRGDEKYDS